MNHLFKPALAAGLALSAIVAPVLSAPAAAQVDGIATVDRPLVIAGAQALAAGYQSIATQYQAQRTTIQQKQQQRQALIQQLDTNSDGQLSEAEQAVLQDANNPTGKQIQAADQEIAQLQAPIQLAQIYVVNQIAQQYPAAVQQVISDKQIKVLLARDALLYGPEEIHVTDEATTALNGRLPAAAVTPPADWQPTEQDVKLYQQIQQILMISQMQAQQAAQQQGQQPAASGR